MKKFVLRYQGFGESTPDAMQAWGRCSTEAARRLPDGHRRAHLRGDADVVVCAAMPSRLVVVMRAAAEGSYGSSQLVVAMEPPFGAENHHQAA